jgi:hypothetical protein
MSQPYNSLTRKHVGGFETRKGLGMDFLDGICALVLCINAEYSGATAYHHHADIRESAIACRDAYTQVYASRLCS